MTKRDDKGMVEQNAEIRRWAEDNGLTLGLRMGQQEDMVERLTPRGSVIEFTVRIDEDVYEAAMLRVTYEGYDSASEVVEEILREWGEGTRPTEMCPASCDGVPGSARCEDAVRHVVGFLGRNISCDYDSTGKGGSEFIARGLISMLKVR